MIEATFDFGHVTVITDLYLKASLPSFLGMGRSVSKLIDCVSFESAVTYWFHSYPEWHQGCIRLGGGCIRLTGSLLFVNFDLLVSLTAPQVTVLHGCFIFLLIAFYSYRINNVYCQGQSVTIISYLVTFSGCVLTFDKLTLFFMA